MPWENIKLNDGTEIPSIAFGTWRIGNGQGPIDQVDQAFSVGFDHIDTAQAYRNEEEAGIAIRESGLKRDEIYVTTKYSGVDGLDVQTSIRNSLKNLGLKYVDLYLIHHPKLAQPDIGTAWREFEKVKEDGLAKSIGVSNFDEADLKILLSAAKIKPVVNQILVHPYVYIKQAPIISYAYANGIITEAYSALSPVTRYPGGPVDTPVNLIAKRLDVTPDQVLLAWTKEKLGGGVVITTSSKKERLEGYLKAGDISLTTIDIAAIDAAGAGGPPKTYREMVKKWIPVIYLLLFLRVLFRYGYVHI